MRAHEDEERELIAAVRNLLTLPGRPEAGNGDPLNGSDGAGKEPRSDEGEAHEEATLEADPGENDEQSEPYPGPVSKRAGIRSLIDAVTGSGRYRRSTRSQRRGSGQGPPQPDRTA